MISLIASECNNKIFIVKNKLQETLNLKRRLNEIYTKHTGQKLSMIEKSMERDNFMSAQEALDFGLIDEIITKRP
jgi:ATP-dependent Clp protease protease subunit